MRVGIGYDAHKLVAGRPLILGGVNVPFEKGLHGHSDADVLIHAIIDALLGAAGLGDIGGMFPDTDAAYKGVSSLILLAEAGRALISNGFSIVNIDSVIIAERPRLAPHIQDMRRNISLALDISVAAVGVKATTEEGMGFTGSGLGMSAQAVASVE